MSYDEATLENTVALATGSSSGIGTATARVIPAAKRSPETFAEELWTLAGLDTVSLNLADG